MHGLHDLHGLHALPSSERTCNRPTLEFRTIGNCSNYAGKERGPDEPPAWRGG